MQMVVYSLSCHTVKLGSQVVRSQLGHRNLSRFVVLFLILERPAVMVLCQSFCLPKYMNLVSRHQLRLSRPVSVTSMSLASGCSVITSQTGSRSPSQCTVRNCLLLSSLYEPGLTAL